MRFVSTTAAPAAVGPYSQAVAVNGFLFCSGMLPINPAVGKIEAEDIDGQANQVLTNIQALLEQEGLMLSDVVKVSVFMRDLADFAEMNRVYAIYFGSHKPARSTFQVAKLPLDAALEIEVVAILKR